MELKNKYPKIAEILQNELKRQRNGLEMIASENYTSLAVLEAAGSIMTNKYSEGYPNARYYGGNEFTDEIEQLAIDEGKKLFNAEHANVQPHSGSQANMAAYLSILKPGEKILAMSLDHGGHLTHGHPVNFSGKLFDFSSYGVKKETGYIDMDEVRETALKEKPKLILAGGSAYPREIDFKAFKNIADEINAYFMVDMAHIAGLIAAGVHADPFPYADIITSTTHKTLRGPRSGIIFSKKEDRLKEHYRPKSKASLKRLLDKAVFPGMQGGPMEHIITGKAICFIEAQTEKFKQDQKQTIENAKVLAESLKEHGFEIISGGTDNHLILIDLTNKNITGALAETALEKAGIHVNKNMIPFDTRSPMDPSGIRLGTPALTTRGFKEGEMKEIAKIINEVIENHNSEEKLKEAGHKVIELTKNFPLYPELQYN